MDRLTNALRQEQALLESLLFKLVETRLLLAAREVRFVPRATREVDRARQRTCGSDLARAAVVDGLGMTNPDMRLGTLRGLAAQATEPWAGMLRDHHEALCGLVAEIELVAHDNSRHARNGIRRLEGRMRAAGDGPDAAPGDPGEDDPAFALVADHTAYRSVLGSADRLRMPALLAFLR